ncbi:hypothetical protein [Geodermatophilus sp. SYSU D01036]
MAGDLRDEGHDVRLGFEVTAVLPQDGGGVVVSSGREALAVDRLVVCAGLQSDTVSRLPVTTRGRRSCRSAASTTGWCPSASTWSEG